MKGLISVLVALCLLCGGFAIAEEEVGLSAASSIIAIAAVAVVMIVLLVLSAKRVKWNASMIAKAAICVAISHLLGMVMLFRMPMGGSVGLVSLLPLILFSMAFGPMEGVLVGCAAGLLHLMVDPYVIHPIQLLVDYPMSYGAVALCCAAKLLPVNDRLRLPIAVVLGYLGKLILTVLSGVVFFAEYAGDQAVLIYSIVYNFSYIGPEMAICAVITFIPGVAKLPKLLRRNSMR